MFSGTGETTSALNAARGFGSKARTAAEVKRIVLDFIVWNDIAVGGVISQKDRNGKGDAQGEGQ